MAAQKKSRPRSPGEDAAGRKRTAERKAANVARNKAQADENVHRRLLGEPTPHEVKVAARRKVRDALRTAGLLAPLGTTQAEWEAKRPGVTRRMREASAVKA